MRDKPTVVTILGGFVVLSMVLTSSGCATMTQSEIKMLETRELDLPYDDAYRAAANGLFALGFTVSHSDKSSGILSGTRHDPNTGGKVAAAVFFGVLGLAATEERNEGVTFMLHALEPELTQLRMKIVVNGKPVVDRQLMTKIWQQIEREAMLESRPSDRIASEEPRVAPSTAPHSASIGNAPDD